MFSNGRIQTHAIHDLCLNPHSGERRRLYHGANLSDRDMVDLNFRLGRSLGRSLSLNRGNLRGDSCSLGLLNGLGLYGFVKADATVADEATYVVDHTGSHPDASERGGVHDSAQLSLRHYSSLGLLHGSGRGVRLSLRLRLSKEMGLNFGLCRSHGMLDDFCPVNDFCGDPNPGRWHDLDGGQDLGLDLGDRLGGS